MTRIEWTFRSRNMGAKTSLISDIAPMLGDVAVN